MKTVLLIAFLLFQAVAFANEFDGLSNIGIMTRDGQKFLVVYRMVAKRMFESAPPTNDNATTRVNGAWTCTRTPLSKVGRLLHERLYPDDDAIYECSTSANSEFLKLN